MAGALRHHGIAVAFLGGEKLRNGDHAAAAGIMRHLGSAHQIFRLQGFFKGARRLILAAAGTAGNKEFQPSEVCRTRCGHRSKKARRRKQNSQVTRFHCNLPGGAPTGAGLLFEAHSRLAEDRDCQCTRCRSQGRADLTLVDERRLAFIA